MRRRLDLAASLLAAPPVLFLDEPTTGLHPRSRQALWATIRGLLADGTTVLLTTQYLEEADQLADHIAVIDGGRIVAEGTAGELKRQVGEERLELVLQRADDVARAVALLGSRATEPDAGTRRRNIGLAVALLGGRAVELDTSTRRLSVAVDSSRPCPGCWSAGRSAITRGSRWPGAAGIMLVAAPLSARLFRRRSAH